MKYKKRFLFFKKSKRANILMENIIFIILNLAFLAILILFLFSKTGNSNVLEEKYAKQMALLVDSAKPLTQIVINMGDAIKKAEKKGVKKIISDQDNIITVRLEEGKGYSYSYFSDVEVNAYCFSGKKDSDSCIININERQKNKDETNE